MVEITTINNETRKYDEVTYDESGVNCFREYDEFGDKHYVHYTTYVPYASILRMIEPTNEELLKDDK